MLLGVGILWSLAIRRWIVTIKAIPHINEGSPPPTLKGPLYIIIPARNEEANLEACLRSLEGQAKEGCQSLKIIVVDDQSVDGTRKVAASLAQEYGNIEVLEAGESPEGWSGKNWACHLGAKKALSGGARWLLFTDADTLFGDGLLARALEYCEREGLVALSLKPKIVCPDLWCEALLPILDGSIAALYPIPKVNDPRDGRAYFYGSFILIKEGAYRELGGHKAVKGELLEDKALAERAKRLGPIRIASAGEAFSSRWASGIKELIRGLVRIVAPLMRGRIRYGLLLTLAAFNLWLLPWLGLSYALGAPAPTSMPLRILLTLLSVYSIACAIVAQALFCKECCSLRRLKALLYPLGALLFLTSLILSVVVAWRGGKVEWKGRDYALSDLA